MQMKLLFQFLLLFWLTENIYSQNVGINTNSPAATAALDVTSPTNDQGLLIPRMLEAQRTAILVPANGLMVYQTDGTAGLYVYKSGQWTTFVTAPNSVPGLELRTASGTVNAATGNTRYSVSVNCPAGKRALGGGLQLGPSSSSCGFSIEEDSPLPPLSAATALVGSESIPLAGLGWTGVVLNRSAGCNYTLVVCVICATAP